MHRDSIYKLISQLLRQGKTWEARSKEATKDSSEIETDKKVKRQQQYIRARRQKRRSSNDHDSEQKRLEKSRTIAKLEELIVVGILLAMKWGDKLIEKK